MSLEMPHSRDGKKTPEKFWVLTRFGFFEDNGSVLFDQSINQSINHQPHFYQIKSNLFASRIQCSLLEITLFAKIANELRR